MSKKLPRKFVNAEDVRRRLEDTFKYYQKTKRQKIRSVGSYSLTRDDLSQARDEVSSPDTRLKGSHSALSEASESLQGTPALHEEVNPRHLNLPKSDVRIVPLEEPGNHTRVVPGSLARKFSLADRETFHARELTRRVSGTMTPTLGAVRNLDDQAFVKYLRKKPDVWVELAPDEIGVDDLTVWVHKTNSRYRVVLRSGKIQDKVEALDSISRGEGQPEGAVFVALLQELQHL